MPKTRTPHSPARSQGTTTPRRKEPRGSRSMCSPALSTASGRLTSLIDQFKDKNMDSFALSPLNGRSVLNDNTDIEEPRRKSWWKKLDDNSRDVMAVLEDNKVTDIDDVIEQLIDIEVLSQEKDNDTLDLPRSSDSESINSIVLPQRKLFTQKENQPQKKFGLCIGNRESLAKLHKTNTNIDKTVNVGTRELFQNAKRSKPVFPAALLNISPNKTTDKTRENLVVEPKPQVRNIFGNRPANKRKNMFANFIMSDSEDEIPEIQPKVFGFQNKPEHRRISSVPKGRDPSPTSSITTDTEMDDWKHLPSSTMVENQLEDMLAGQTPIKRARLSKLSEAKESEVGTNTVQTYTTFDKTQSNKTVSSKNKSKYSSELKEKTLDNSRTTRSMSRNTSKSEESMNKQVNKNSKSLSKNASKNNEFDASKLENKLDQEIEEKLGDQVMEVEADETKDDDEGRSKLDNTLLQVAEKEPKIHEMENNAKEVKNNDKSLFKLKDTLKEVEEEREDQGNERNKTKDDGKSPRLENSANKTKDNDAGFSKLQNTFDEGKKKREGQDMEDKANKTKNNDKGISKLEDTPKKVEEGRKSVEMENRAKKTKDNDASLSKLKNALEEVEEKREGQEMENEAIESENNAEVEEGSQEMGNAANETVEIDETFENQEIEAEVTQETKEANESEQEEVNESKQEEANESEQEKENESEEEDENESEQEEENESEQEEENESEQEEENETEDENNSHQIEANESHEKQKEADNRQEIEKEETEHQEDDDDDNQESKEKADETEEVANVSQEVEGEEVEMENNADDSEEETQENEDSANESQEIESEREVDQQSEAEANDSVEEDEEMEYSDEADKAIASDGEMSDQDDQEEMEVDEESNEAVDGSEQVLDHETNENRSAEPSAEEIDESPDVTHDTTGRNRKKQALNKSPEVVLHNKTNQMDSFTTNDRNTNLRKTKSMIKNLNIRPSLAPARDSIGFSDGTKNSSAEGSGWDSHRTTRKTLRQTFGKDFTPRKSLRALVMEKSAKRQTEHVDVHSETVKFPEANSTELPEDSNRVGEDIVESDHEESRRIRQTTLEMYLQKIKQQNMEKRIKMAETVRNSLKGPPRDPLNIFKAPSKPAPRSKSSQNKPKKQIKSVISLDELPAEILQDMKYKPPKRFQPTNASWITKRLYKYLENKLEPKYDYKARVRAEKLVESIYNFAKDLRRHQVAPTDAVEVLKFEFARLEIVKTHHQFYGFFHEFMPREVRIKVIPDLVNKIPLPRHGVFSDIIRSTH